MPAPNENRDLTLVRKNGSTTRVWNLTLVAERFGDTPEHGERPVFISRRLNKAMIVRHALRANEADGLPRGTRTATKVILPYTADDLRNGGESFFTRQQNADRILRDRVGGYNEPGSLRRDLRTLELLDQLPSLDPFLVRERLRKDGLEPARCYFEIAEADVERMRTFVSDEITTLVALAFEREGIDARALAAKLADKLMTDENAAALDPLKLTLRLSGDEYKEGIFAWKGFLYYKWMVNDLGPRMQSFAREILSIRMLAAAADDRRRLAEMRERIIGLFSRKLDYVRDEISRFDTAFQEMTGQGRATAFRSFLLSAPRRFETLGESLGIINHMNAFWRYRFPEGEPRALTTDEAYAMFEEFEQLLAGAADGPKRQPTAVKFAN